MVRSTVRGRGPDPRHVWSAPGRCGPCAARTERPLGFAVADEVEPERRRVHADYDASCNAGSCSIDGAYEPWSAAPLHVARWIRARWAATTLASSPRQICRAGCWRARPNENTSGQGDRSADVSLTPDVHGVQPRRSQFGGLPARQERDAGDGRRDRSLQTGERRLATASSPRLLRTVQARQHHVRLQDHRLQRRRPARPGRRTPRAQHRVRHLAAALHRVVSRHQHLGLDDRDQAGFLAQGGVAGQRMCVRADARLARAGRRRCR